MMRTFVLRSDKEAQALWKFLKVNWKGMADTGRALEVSIGEYKHKRSVEQNKRLHALLTDIAESAYVNGFQYSSESWKEYYRRKFIGTEEIRFPDGTAQERGISTTTLSVSEFADFMNRIEAHAVSELGVFLPSLG